MRTISAGGVVAGTGAACDVPPVQAASALRATSTRAIFTDSTITVCCATRPETARSGRVNLRRANRLRVSVMGSVARYVRTSDRDAGIAERTVVRVGGAVATA